MFPPRIILFPYSSFNISNINVVVVDLPFVPVIPIVGQGVNLWKRLISISISFPAFSAI
jgi:hypothetical protein